MPWLLLMLIFPLYTGLAYLLIKTDVGHRMFKKNYARRVVETKKYIPQKDQILQQMREQSSVNAHLAEYLANYGGYPVYRNYRSEYFPLGEQMFEAMKREIRNAKRYIFLEFFIIDKGMMWEELLVLLKKKASQGIDIRIMYDGFGTQFIMPMQYFQKLEQYGIQCRVFNGFKPFLTSSQNNRDHRKILVIDGHTAFTGGINIADEYINQKVRFGHWKDGGVMCQGEAAWSFTVMFLQLWHLEETDNGELEEYRHLTEFPANHDGFVQPYSDSPTDGEYVGRNVYLDIINNAQDYVYIMTPYLVLDHELITALGLAAKKGVDVRLMMPHIPDKWYVYSIAWSYYQELLTNMSGFMNICRDSFMRRISVLMTESPYPGLSIWITGAFICILNARRYFTRAGQFWISKKILSSRLKNVWKLHWRTAGSDRFSRELSAVFCVCLRL